MKEQEANIVTRRRFLKIATVAAASGLLSGCETVTIPQSLPKYTGPDKKIYLGMTAATAKPEDVAALERQLGITWPIQQRYIDWGTSVIDAALFSQFDRMRSNPKEAGKIPLITWQPWDQRLSDKVNQEKYALRNIIAGDHDEYIAFNAENIKKYGRPMFLRPLPEMNGNWNPWSGSVNGNSSSEYAPAWRHIYDIFSKVGTENVTWVFAPSTYTPQGAPDLSAYFPGEDQLDWFGLDANNHGGTEWKSFAEIATEPYREERLLSEKKPIMISETGSSEVGGDKGKWLRDMLWNMGNDFPGIAGVVMLHREKLREEGIDWRVTSTPEAFAGFKEGVSQTIYDAKTVRVENNKIVPIGFSRPLFST
jgi:hypothetical protein